MESNKKLVDYLKRSGVLKEKKLEKAMREIDRGLFCERSPYADNAQPIGFGATISQPSTVVMMTQALKVKDEDKVLEVGTGSGYQAALLWAMGCRVFSIERKREVLEKAKANLEKVGADVKLILGDGSLGWEEEAPYNAIIVTAAAPAVPNQLISQLKDGGRLVIPVGRIIQKMKVIEKNKDRLKEKSLGFFQFIPLLGEEGF